MSLPIHPVPASSAQLLASSHAAAFDKGEAWDAASIARLLETPGVVALATAPATASPLDGPLEGSPDGFVLFRIAADEAEVLTLAVRPQARRRGIAAALLDRARAQALAAGARTWFLEVAEDNTAARALYAACGFHEAGRRRGYYRNGAADALVLRWHAERPHTARGERGSGAAQKDDDAGCLD